jgi:hypothetical protein
VSNELYVLIQVDNKHGFRYATHSKSYMIEMVKECIRYLDDLSDLVLVFNGDLHNESKVYYGNQIKEWFNESINSTK